mgnify:CR=1 FL=1
MVDGRFEALGGGDFRAVGELTFETVPEVWERSRGMFEAGAAEIGVEFSGVTWADSAGLALLIEWVRSAREAGVALRFRDIPEQMLAIARVSGVEDILPLDAD